MRKCPSVASSSPFVAHKYGTVHTPYVCTVSISIFAVCLRPNKRPFVEGRVSIYATPLFITHSASKEERENEDSGRAGGGGTGVGEGVTVAKRLIEVKMSSGERKERENTHKNQLQRSLACKRFCAEIIIIFF